MKKSISILAMVAMLSVSANAQDAARPKARIKGNLISAPVARREQPAAAVTEENTVQGIFPKMIRTDQPLQMLNPVAPREYGNGSAFVNSYADGPGQGPKNQKNYTTAFKLFAFEF